MAITKENVVDVIETLEDGTIRVRTATVIKEDSAELNRTFHRHLLVPSTKSSGSWADTDISSETTRVQAICNAVWTADVKKAYQDAWDASAPS